MRVQNKIALLFLTAAPALLTPGCRNDVTPPKDKAGAAPAFSFPKSTPVARKDAFFGLHFDLHPQASDTMLGADISEDNIRDLLERVRPDYVQYDCKGQAGWTGYPAAAGWASPGIVKDSLAVSLRTTRDGKLSVHLLNTAGRPLPDRYGFTDFIPPLEQIGLTIRTPLRPKTVTWVPDGGRLGWSWSDGRLHVTVPKLKIHGIVVIE